MDAEGAGPLSGEADEREEREYQEDQVGRKIPIRNLYHLLAYAFDVRFLNWEEVKSVEDDDHAGYFELLSHVLVCLLYTSDAADE